MIIDETDQQFPYQQNVALLEIAWLVRRVPFVASFITEICGFVHFPILLDNTDKRRQSFFGSIPT
jgi:hypothetical protein